MQRTEHTHADSDQLAPGDAARGAKGPVRPVILFTLAITTFVIGVVALLGVFADWRAYTVQGGSMEPHYSSGDLIITSSDGAREVQPGEIIVFVADWASEKYGRRVVHRVAAVGEIDGMPVAYTRGDANSISDPMPVDLRGDVRLVRYSLPVGGLWLQALTGPVIVSVLVSIIVALVAGAVTLVMHPAIQLRVERGRSVGRGQLVCASETQPTTDLRTLG